MLIIAEPKVMTFTHQAYIPSCSQGFQEKLSFYAFDIFMAKNHDLNVKKNDTVEVL